MIIKDFTVYKKIEESIALGMSEDQILENFNGLDEGILDSIKNYLSRMFGGSISKIDTIIKKYKNVESDYWDEWSAIKSNVYKEELLRNETTSPIEKSKHEQRLERLDKQLKQLDLSRTQQKDALAKQAKNLLKNERISDYYEKVKAKTDEEIAKDSYESAKEFADEKLLNKMYSHMQRSIEVAKDKDKKFKEKYKNEVGEEGSDDVLASTPLTATVKTKLEEKTKDQLKHLKSLLDAKIDKLSEKKPIPGINRESIKNLEDKIYYIDKILVGEVAKKETPTDTSSVTDTPVVTPKEEPKEEAPVIPSGKEEIENEPIVGVNKEMDKGIKEYFDAERTAIEASLDIEKIEDTQFTHLKNDLVSLFGKVFTYHKDKAHGAFNLKQTKVDLLDFATTVYEYKKKKKILDRNLTKQEVNELFDKYEK